MAAPVSPSPVSPSPVSPSPVPPGPVPHSLAEDAYALVTGCVLLVLGIALLHAAGLATGGMAGIALLASYLVPLPASVLFTLLNIPFFWFARKTMGTRFMLRTILVNGGIALFGTLTRASLHIDAVHPLFAALVGGTVIGLGILIIARHNAGVGGTGVITLWLLKHRGWNAGRTQIAIDMVIVLASFAILPPGKVAWSALSAAAISGVLIAWHKPGRYTGH